MCNLYSIKTKRSDLARKFMLSDNRMAPFEPLPMPRRDLSQMRSWSTMLTMAIGALSSRAAKAVIGEDRGGIEYVERDLVRPAPSPRSKGRR